MIYVFDTSSLRVLQNYFPDSFPTFWQNWEQEVALGKIISVREVKRELDLLAVSEHLIDWSNSNRQVFFRRLMKNRISLARFFQFLIFVN